MKCPHCGGDLGGELTVEDLEASQELVRSALVAKLDSISAQLGVAVNKASIGDKL